MRILATILTVTLVTAFHDSTAQAQTPAPTQQMTALVDSAARAGFQGQVLAVSNSKTVFAQTRGGGVGAAGVCEGGGDFQCVRHAPA